MDANWRDDACFPATHFDKVVAGLLCDLVSTMPGRYSIEYLDRLVIAASKKVQLLPRAERPRFAQLLDESIGEPEKLDWFSLKRLLLLNRAIVSRTDNSVTGRHDARLWPAERMAEVRDLYPRFNSEFLSLLQRAGNIYCEITGLHQK